MLKAFQMSSKRIGTHRSAPLPPSPSPGPLYILRHILTRCVCSGSFHADEALAVYLLRLTPTYKNAPVTRSRNSDILSQCDIVVDVEGKYDGVKYFDHHQRGFEHVFSDKFGTKLSSAGLIYKYVHRPPPPWVLCLCFCGSSSSSRQRADGRHFGKDIIAQRLGWSNDDPNVQLLYDRLYQVQQSHPYAPCHSF